MPECSLTFSVGPQPLQEFRMIERHYYKDHLLKSFDFTFGYVMPNSVNSWEAIYNVPKLDKKMSASFFKIFLFFDFVVPAEFI
jgi:hypothetical protein